MNLLLLLLLISIGLNLLMFLPAFLLKTDKLTDISYALSFIFVALVGYLFSSKSSAQLIATVLVIIWAIRLGVFLLVRIRKIKKDKRFDKIRGNVYKFLGFWVLQGITVYIVLVPSIFLWNQEINQFNTLSIIGLVIFASGLLIETVADYQKYNFNNTGRKTWIDTGLWRATRHPNYLGEIMLWIGVYLFVVPYLDLWQNLITLVGPLYIALLLIFVSGIPILEKSNDKKWGGEHEYKKYKSDVPVLLPSISSIRRLFAD